MVGVLARFEVKPDLEWAVSRFFEDGLAVVNDEPHSTSWFAFRIDATTYEASAVFAGEEDRASLLEKGGLLSSRHAVLSSRAVVLDTALGINSGARCSSACAMDWDELANAIRFTLGYQLRAVYLFRRGSKQ
jgi:hypothetical protein